MYVSLNQLNPVMSVSKELSYFQHHIRSTCLIPICPLLPAGYHTIKNMNTVSMIGLHVFPGYASPVSPVYVPQF